MMSGSATVKLVVDEHGSRAVVTQADDIIWIAGELRNLLAGKSDRSRIAGDIEIDEDLVSFGTPGEGLGRLTYRVVERRARWVVCERVRQ